MTQQEIEKKVLQPMDLADMALDAEAQDEGKWVDIGLVAWDQEKVFKVKLMSAHSPIARQAYDAKLRKKQKECGGKQLTQLQQDTVELELLGDTLVKDWENFPYENELIPFSREKCIEMMNDRKFTLISKAWLILCESLETHRLERAEKSRKKSGKRSDTEQ